MDVITFILFNESYAFWYLSYPGYNFNFGLYFMIREEISAQATDYNK